MTLDEGLFHRYYLDIEILYREGKMFRLSDPQFTKLLVAERLEVLRGGPLQRKPRVARPN